MDKLGQLPRHSLYWLLAAVVAGVLPHSLYLPWWVTLVTLAAVFWRLQVLRGQWRLPGKWLRAAMVASAVSAVLLQYHSLFGPRAGTALLMLGYGFKLLETEQRRDAFLVVVLGFVVVAALFFFAQSMLVTAYLLLVIWALIAALIAMNQNGYRSPWVALKLAARLLLQALPLMLVLFLLVPRIAPLWSLDLSQSRARTGLSDHIALGDIASLSQSDELAFRVVFEGAAPAQQQLYWRALVLDYYDGKQWGRGSFAMDQPPMVSYQGVAKGWHRTVETIGDPVTYQVLMEPTDQPWLFSLRGLSQFERRLGYTQDHRLLNPSPVSQPQAYQLTSAMDSRLDAQLPQWAINKNLQLPEGGNPRTRQLARELRAESTDVSHFVNRTLQYLANQGFSYTLNPGQLLDEEQVDQFLFERKKGFCSHFASAFVYMMRAAGVPARLVTGYQGGEYNQMGGYWLIHQFDAHAWAEVWQPQQGWQRVDPTAVVSPLRVESGVEEALAGEQSFLADNLLSPARYRHWPWLSQIRHGLDYLNYAWYRAVLGYDAQMQMVFLSRWLGELNIQRLAFWLLAAVAVLVALLALLLLGKRTPTTKDPLLLEYQRFCQKMARRGVRRAAGETPDDFTRRLISQWPEQAAVFEQINRIFQRHYYRQPPVKTLTTDSRQACLVLRRLRQQL